MALFQLVPSVFLSAKAEKYFDCFGDEYPEIVYLNQSLVDRVTPEVFDLAKRYEYSCDLQYVEIDDHGREWEVPADDCPEETIEKWGSRGTKFLNLIHWIMKNNSNIRLEKFMKYVSRQEKLDNFSMLPKEYRAELVKNHDYTPDEILITMLAPSFTPARIPAIHEFGIDPEKILSFVMNVKCKVDDDNVFNHLYDMRYYIYQFKTIGLDLKGNQQFREYVNKLYENTRKTTAYLRHRGQYDTAFRDVNAILGE